MKITNDIISKANAAARQQYNNFPNGAELYEQAIRLVQQCNVIAVQNELNSNDKLLVNLAGLFLFTGGQKAGFIEESILQITHFLESEQIDEDNILEVKEVLSSIKPPQLPMTAAGQVLCDALNSFWLEENKGLVIDLPVFVKEAITGKHGEITLTEAKQFIEKLRFFGPGSLKMFEKLKKKKLTWFQREIEVHGAGSTASDSAKSTLDHLMIEGEKPQMARGTETMFRISSREHSELLAMVHQKSGFLASINAIILSIILSVLSTKLDENPHLLVPTILLLITCVTTIYFAVLATKPVFLNSSNESFNTETQNIMFFGHYSNIPWKDYSEKLKKITKEDAALFETFSKNIYYQGLVLKKKYNLLAIGYNVFVWGLMTSIFAFVISLILHSYVSN